MKQFNNRSHAALVCSSWIWLWLIPHNIPVSPQNAMNLPPDKARLLRQYDNEKKWELICDQVRNLWRAFGRCLFPAAPSTASLG